MKEVTKSALGIVVYFAVIIITANIGLPIWLVYIIWVVAALVWVLFFTKKSETSLDKLYSDIVEKLKKTGYECEMLEGHISLKRNERRWHVYLSETNMPNMYYVTFRDYFSLGDEAISPEGKAILFDAANYNYPGSKVIVLDEGYLSYYRATIRNKNDFMVEFSNAWDVIIDPIQWLGEKWDSAVQSFPSAQVRDSGHENKIGFQHG